MKIVMITELYADNVQYQENLLAKYYVKHGHAVTVIASTSNDSAEFYADRHDASAPARTYFDGAVKVIKLPYSLNLLNRLRRFSGVAEILEHEKPGLIFIHDIHLNLVEAGRYKKRHPECRIIMDYHADYTNSGKNWLSLKILHGVIRKRLLWHYRKYIDKICPVVPISITFLAEVYGIPREEQELLPLGSDTDLANGIRSGPIGGETRQRLGIPADALVIFTGGKLRPLKQTHLLLQAFNKLANPKLHLIVVGEGDVGYESYKAELLAQATGNPNIHFVGWVHGAEVYHYMAASDIAVFPASQSVLWQQSISMGLPLIVGEGTHLGTQDPSYLNLHDNVIILPQEEISADAIAGRIDALVRDPADLARRTAAALRTSDELLNYDRIIESTLRFA